MTMRPQSIRTSPDKRVRKALLELEDGASVETVLIRHRSHYTACISSQAGCALGCVFCATGQAGFVRDLTAREMTAQIDFWNTRLKTDKERVKNVVFMGMGEPFLNWEHLKEALFFINSARGQRIGQRKITVSTAGIIDKIEEFTREKTQINLAVSLHSAVEETRSLLMPVNKKHPLPALSEACLNYVKQTGRKLFFEYTLFRDLNDTQREIERLLKLIQKHYLFHLNIIPYNATGCALKPSERDRRGQIIDFLKQNRAAFTVRKSFGSDICAACGQLKARETRDAQATFDKKTLTRPNPRNRR